MNSMMEKPSKDFITPKITQKIFQDIYIDIDKWSKIGDNEKHYVVFQNQVKKKNYKEDRFISEVV